MMQTYKYLLSILWEKNQIVEKDVNKKNCLARITLFQNVFYTPNYSQFSIYPFFK